MAGWNDPAHRLDANRLQGLFKQIDFQLGLTAAQTELATSPDKLRIVVCGGAAMCFKIEQRGTGDVDIIYPPMPPELADAAREIRKRNGLPADWMNDAPRAFADYRHHVTTQTLFEGRFFTVVAPTDEFLLGMKVQAGRETDIDDTVWLMGSTGKTTAEELKQAAEQVSTATGRDWDPQDSADFIEDCINEHRELNQGHTES